MMTAAGGRVMATRTLNVLPDVIRVAQPLEITLPRYWMELDLFDHLGEERTSYYRIAESGVFTKIVRSHFMYDGNFKWRIETTFSSNWTNQLFEEADVGALLGWGFAPWTGGPLSYIDAQGLPAFVARCDELAERYGSKRLRPPEALRRIAKDGGTIYGTNWQRD